jgi:hypothetical protein
MTIIGRYYGAAVPPRSPCQLQNGEIPYYYPYSTLLQYASGAVITSVEVSDVGYGLKGVPLPRC